MHARADTCIGGLHEVGVGVSDLERAIKDFTAYGCHLLERGRLDAQAAQQLYGVTSAVDSVRLGHLDSDHGLIHLMQWEQALNAGLGVTPNLRAVGSRWGVRLTASVFNIVNHAELAQKAGATLTLLPPELAVIGEVSGQHAVQPFATPVIGVREMVLLHPEYRQVFFERFNYDSPGYGKIHQQSLLLTSQHTHCGLMIANDDPHIFDFYEDVLGLKRMHEEWVPYENATGSRSIFGLEPGEGFHMVDFDDPRSGHALTERRSGKLKCVRFASGAKIPDLRAHSRAGCLGYSLYCWRTADIEGLHRRLESAGVAGLSAILPDEFGRLALTFFAPDGYHWKIVQSTLLESS
jgi:catechol 2,3-dioxygenase-like lactoylglutathione lyase family enzyme